LIPAGLLCATCALPFNRAYARRTHIGYVHARPCASPVVLNGGQWVNKGGVMRWEAA